MSDDTELGGLEPIRDLGKQMSAGGGGGTFIDPNYEHALAILGTPGAAPKPWEQRALTMTDPEAAELAGLLTSLEQAPVGSQWWEAPIGGGPEQPSGGQVIRELIAALGDRSVERSRIEELIREVERAGSPTTGALLAVLEHPGVQARLEEAPGD